MVLNVKKEAGQSMVSYIENKVNIMNEKLQHFTVDSFLLCGLLNGLP